MNTKTRQNFQGTIYYVQLWFYLILTPLMFVLKKVSRQIWQTHIDCCRGHRGSFEFQFGVAGKAIRKERGGKCKLAKGKSATSPITHRGESFVSVWGALIPLFFNCLLYKRTKYWFRPLYTTSGECRLGMEQKCFWKPLHKIPKTQRQHLYYISTAYSPKNLLFIVQN